MYTKLITLVSCNYCVRRISTLDNDPNADWLRKTVANLLPDFFNYKSKITQASGNKTNERSNRLRATFCVEPIKLGPLIVSESNLLKILMKNESETNDCGCKNLK